MKQSGLKCAMERDCKRTVTHIDTKGFVYCGVHGEQRNYWQRCRRLTSIELRELAEKVELRKG